MAALYPFTRPIKPTFRLMYKPLPLCSGGGLYLDVYFPSETPAGLAPVVLLVYSFYSSKYPGLKKLRSNIHGGRIGNGDATVIPYNQVPLL